jgi:hypothetical protein
MAEKHREVDRLSKSPCGAVENLRLDCFLQRSLRSPITKPRGWRVRKQSHQVCWGIEEMTKHSNGVPET